MKLSISSKIVSAATVGIMEPHMPRLTPQEQQKIFRFVEADKPLSEKYRFLLFEDKREVELVWNGKSNNVYDVIISFQRVDEAGHGN